MSIFNYNGKLMNFLTTFWDIVWLGILWFVCSIPIITIGAASTAAYYSMSKSIRRSTGHVTQEFFRSFRDNFKQATILSLIYLFIGIVLSADCYFFYHSTADFALAGRIISYILVAVYLSAMVYGFAWLSRFQVKTGSILKYSFQLAVAHLPQTLAIVIFFFAFAILIYWFWWAAFFAPGIICFLNSLMLEPLLKKCEPLASESHSESSGD